MQSASRTTIQPVLVCQTVSTTIEPGTYARRVGTAVPTTPTRKFPASRSSIAAKTLGASWRGAQSHSTLPSGAMSAFTSQSERNA